ncbi:MAG TPA: NAD(P)-binding domain-containing protein [Vicinamibacterales bacterium]|nr:NAD(P)-binding domain-containing protein [Vicinamibacterales bacterium]
MNIAFLGAGAMAIALGRRFIAAGHRLVVSYSREPGKIEKTATELGGGTQVRSPADAAQFADIVVLATGWGGAAGALEAAGSLRDKLIWSIVTPFKADLSGLALGTTISGSEELAKRAVGARFVAGWPPFADVLASSSTRFGGERQSLFYCGDDPRAKHEVEPLFHVLDVDPIDAGPLYAARFIEPAMFLLVHLAYVQKMGAVAARLLRR